MYLYSYDSLGRLISSGMKSPQGTMLLRTSQSYDANNRLLSQGWQLGADGYSESYTYNNTDGSLNTMTTGSGDTLTMGYDVLRRLASIDAGIYTAAYSYRDLSDTATTLQVAGLQYTGLADSLSFGYTYDEVGNLATYTETQGESSSTTTYTYDSQGQLTSATDGTTTHTYTYDTVGNILTASDGTAAHTYSYTNDQWQDLLTAFDNQAIAYQGQTYDAETNTVTGTPTSGNPVSYYNGTRWTFGWANGRQLVSADSTGTEVDFTYSADGLRMTKTVGSVTHTYYYAGRKLLRETYGDTTLDFFYDANGNPFALKHNNATYYYITNHQGDVLRLVDADGETVAEYTYDPYGKPLTATGTLASVNPLRYRGYYYDTETGFYYLQSRYYDPTICRFINADGYASTGQGILGHNMFAYCGSNPIAFEDSSGGMRKPTTVAINDGGHMYPIFPDVSNSPEEQESGMVNGQGNLPYSNTPIGLGSYGTSGCAYIAIYNALQLIEKPQTLASITQEIFWIHGTLYFGAAGVAPWSMETYFSAHGIKTAGSISKERITKNVSEGDVIVFTVLNDKNNIFMGWHAMTALYTRGEYLVFNQYNNSTTYNRYSSLDKAFPNGAWIYGMRID